ncbi:MAG: class I tRNA ligase family protein, partial [Chloroflexota bacterium]
PARRETDTTDTFLDSSWYFLRYASPRYAPAAFDPEAVRFWMPVDIYTGGAEHAVMHLFYARFFTKALRDMGLVEFDEPFTRLFNQGTIIAQRQKMSKSRGNVVNPDSYVSELGADAVRAYLMFVGPWEQGGEWDDSGISGMGRWFNRVWNLATEPYEEKVSGQVLARLQSKDPAKDLSRLTHQTIRKVTEDLAKLRLNTMLSSLMEFTNYLGKVREEGTVAADDWNSSIRILLLLLAPTAPHLTEELWESIGGAYSIHNQPWPAWEEELVKEEEITLVVQVNGKLRDRITVPASITEDEATKLALESPRVKTHLEDKEVARVIYVPGRLVNLVVK